MSVPGISYKKEGTVWAPNIEGWDNYPLLKELSAAAGDVIIDIDNDRACSILGELWVGNAKGCHDAIFLAVGTGIGAGIVLSRKYHKRKQRYRWSNRVDGYYKNLMKRNMYRLDVSNTTHPGMVLPD